MSALLKLMGEIPDSDAKPLIAAYDRVLHELNLVDRDDPLAHMIAKSVIKVGRSGVAEPDNIAVQVLREVGPIR